MAVLLTTAGLQVPVTPLDEVAGNAGTASPSQIVAAVPKVKEGVITGFTVTVRVTEGEQGFDVLLNVYVPLVVLLTTAGVQVPVIPLVEVVGKSGAVAPEQIDTAVPKLNTGVVFG